jgi:hypothetical protein
MNDTVASIYFCLPSLSILRTSGRNEETAVPHAIAATSRRVLQLLSRCILDKDKWTKTAGRPSPPRSLISKAVLVPQELPGLDEILGAVGGAF